MAIAVTRGQVTGPRRLGLLPAEATSFVGRTIELAGISALLGTARMVTVTGPAGVGKTRLSQRAAAAAADRFPDGVWLADLAAVSRGSDPPYPTQISDLALVAGVVAEALGLPAADDDAALLVLLHHLRGRRLLLILDTCEHLVDACAAFADTVLRAAPGVSLLATSRQPLDAPGEHAFPVLPLPAEDDAVDLFAQRAVAVDPGFTVTPQNRADVVRLCQRLDGLPLAIELAAVRLRALPLAELASQLESGIRMLTVSRRGTSPRHQTLRAAVEWSYQLCTPAERALWERLSVFTETFDVSGAEDVCADGDLPRGQIIHALVGLVDKSVVLRDGADPSRYRLLGALREFGADRLAEAGGQEWFLDRLTARSLAMATDFDERFGGCARAGSARAGGDDSDGAAGDQCRSLAGDVDGAIECCDRGLSMLAAAEDHDAPNRERWVSGYLHLVSGLALAQRPGREQACAVALRRALAAKYELGDVAGMAHAVEALAWLAARREQYERTAWLLGAADQLWARTGRRLSGIDLMEESRRHVAGATRMALGDRRYIAAYAHGGVLDLAAVVRDAVDVPGVPTGPTGGAAVDAVVTGDTAGGGDRAPAQAGTLVAALTRREREIAELVGRGLSNREVAARLFISKRTVDAHVEHIFSKLEISSRVQLTLLLQDQAPRARAAGA